MPGRFALKTWVALALLAGRLASTGIEAQAEEPLRAAALTGYAPYSDAELPNLGFSNDLLVQAMKRTGHAVTIIMLPWARALAGAEDGSYDILPSTWYTTERAQTLLFSEPYIANRLVFVKRKNSAFEFTRLEDLAGKTIGTVIGYAYGDAFLNSPLFEREAAYDAVFNLRKLEAGRIDLVIDDEFTLKYLLQTKVPDLADRLALTKGALSEQMLYMGFSKKRSDAASLVADFNAALVQMKSDGSYQAILRAHKLE